MVSVSFPQPELLRYRGRSRAKDIVLVQLLMYPADPSPVSTSPRIWPRYSSEDDRCWKIQCVDSRGFRYSFINTSMLPSAFRRWRSRDAGCMVRSRIPIKPFRGVKWYISLVHRGQPCQNGDPNTAFLGVSLLNGYSYW